MGDRWGLPPPSLKLALLLSCPPENILLKPAPDALEVLPPDPVLPNIDDLAKEGPSSEPVLMMGDRDSGLCSREAGNDAGLRFPDLAHLFPSPATAWSRAMMLESDPARGLVTLGAGENWLLFWLLVVGRLHPLFSSANSTRARLATCLGRDDPPRSPLLLPSPYAPASDPAPAREWPVRPMVGLCSVLSGLRDPLLDPAGLVIWTAQPLSSPYSGFCRAMPGGAAFRSFTL